MPTPTYIDYYVGTQADFEYAKEHSLLYVGSLYYISDSHRLYRANNVNDAEEYCDNVVMVDDFPTTNIRQGVLYVKASTGASKVYTGSGYVSVSSGSISIDNTVSYKNNNNSSVPSTDAVYTYFNTNVTQKIADPTALDITQEATKFVTLNGSGKIPTEFIPSYAISNYRGAYQDETAMNTALGSDTEIAEGDYIKITGDTNKGTWVLNNVAQKSSLASGWVQISTPDSNTEYTGGNGITVDTLSQNNPISVSLSDATGNSLSFVSNKLYGTNTTYSAGSGISIDTNSNNQISIKLASGTNSLSINGSGELVGVNSTYGAASVSELGLVKVDDDTIKVDGNGVISAPRLAWKTIATPNS